MRIVVPLTGGMTLTIALQMWNPTLPRDRRQVLHLGLQLLLIFVCAVLVGVLHVPVPLIMVLALTAGALLP